MHRRPPHRSPADPGLLDRPVLPAFGWFLALAVAVAAAPSVLAATADDEAAATAAPRPTVTQLRAATYDGIDTLGPLTLADGQWESDPPEPDGVPAHRVTLEDELVVYCDLDGDGDEEAVAGLALSNGSTGRHLHLAAVDLDGDTLRNLGTAPVGDRVEVMAVATDGDRVVVDLVAAGPEDPTCCPTLKLRKTYALRDGAWAETASEELGMLSIADLEGVEWRLEALDWEERVPAGVAITATFADGTLVGESGCNRYHGSYAVSQERPLLLGPMTRTRRACPPPAGDWEARYLPALERVDHYQFHNARLLLQGKAEDGSNRVLLFRRGD